MDSTSQLSGQKRKVRGSCFGSPVLVVSTSRPSFTSTASAGSGSLTLICPRTGTVLSSCRIQGGDLQSNSSNGLVGINTLSFFPSASNGATAIDPSMSTAIAYGATTGAQRSKGAHASYGMLFTVAKSSTAPTLHWKCHLPEPDLSAGLLVSPVSRHVVAGGSSGTLYVWNPLQGGCLVRSIPSAHYRAITCMQWSVAKEGSLAPPSASSIWDCHLITGGADGMVHMFSHLDLVEQPSSTTSNSSVKPIRTWTRHHLAVTALVALNGGRMVSASEDGQVVIMELCSGETVATFQMPDPIKSLTTDGERRIFAGSSKGVIYVVDLDEYAIHQTIQTGATIVHQPSQQAATTESRVFGGSSNPVGAMTDSATDSSSSFLKEMRGHDSAITSLVVFQDEHAGRNTEYLVSGDENGMLRVWDSRRRCCLCLVHPWSSTAGTTTPSNKVKAHAEEAAQYHPVTSIHVMREQTNAFLGGSMDGDVLTLGKDPETRRTKVADSLAVMIAPLQKYALIQDAPTVPVPYLEPLRGNTSLFTDLGSFSFEKALVWNEARSLGKLDKVQDVETTIPSDNKQQEEIERLKNELEEAKATIQRWEVVNNKLIGKLKEYQNK